MVIESLGASFFKNMKLAVRQQLAGYWAAQKQILNWAAKKSGKKNTNKDIELLSRTKLKRRSYQSHFLEPSAVARECWRHWGKHGDFQWASVHSPSEKMERRLQGSWELSSSWCFIGQRTWEVYPTNRNLSETRRFDHRSFWSKSWSLHVFVSEDISI